MEANAGSKRLYDNGITRCGACKNKVEQQKCPDFIRATFERRCMFLINGNMCDWHPDYHCVKHPNGNVPAPTGKKTKVVWTGWGTYRIEEE